MLNFSDRRKFYQCDGIARRSFLQVGGLALGGMALPQMLQAEATSGIRDSQKSVIMIYLTGGPPHQDMVDLKPHAPAEISANPSFDPIRASLRSSP